MDIPSLLIDSAEGSGRTNRPEEQHHKWPSSVESSPPKYVTEGSIKTKRSAGELCRNLQACHRTMPRFLFRGWNHLSGGDSRLNTADRITPKAFFDNPRPAIHLCQHPHGREIVDNHLETRRGSFSTEFSSWTNSLELALSFAGYYTSSSVSVIDRDLWSENLAVHWVPDLFEDGLASISIDVEWLVHGVVTGPGLLSYQVNTHILQGVDLRNPRTSTPWDLAGVMSFDIAQALRIARAFLGLDNRQAPCHSQLQREHRGVFYFLILTWLASIIKLNKPKFGANNFQALIGSIQAQTRIKVPENLPAGFVRDFPFEDKRYCNDGRWTRSLVLLVSDTPYRRVRMADHNSGPRKIGGSFPERLVGLAAT